MTQTIESLAQQIHSLEACSGEGRHAYTLLSERLYLARGPNDSIELFIEGERATFGLAAVGHSLQWGEYYDLNQSRNFHAVVIRALGGGGAVRLMAHLAYEAYQLVTDNPRITNSELLERLTPFVSLVIQRSILGLKYQFGLTAELLLMFELINFAEQQNPPVDNRLVLESWNGWDSARRDYSGGSIAVEVKATFRDSRRHIVHPMQQLLSDPSQPGERVYIYSVGLRPDRSGSFRTLTALDRVFARLHSDAKSTFTRQLRSYGGSGFDPELRSYYELEPGFLLTLTPSLFRIDNVPDILRPESFVGRTPPARAKRIRYEVSLEGLQPVRADERDTVFRNLLRQAN
jgi:hypothetical protein